MKKLLLPLFLIISALCVQAQTAHHVDLSWAVVSITGVNYNVYRAPCNGTVINQVCSAEGTYAIIKTVPGTTNAYSDTSVAAGARYVYYLTSVCPATGCQAGYGGESGPSNRIAVDIPTNTPPPPGSLTIIQLAMNSVGGSSYVTAKWQSPDSSTRYALSDWKSIPLLNSQGNSADGSYAYSWKIKKQAKPVSLSVCDSAGCVTASSGQQLALNIAVE